MLTEKGCNGLGGRCYCNFYPTRQPWSQRGPSLPPAPAPIGRAFLNVSSSWVRRCWLYNAREEPRSSALITHSGNSVAATLQDLVPPALSTGQHNPKRTLAREQIASLQWQHDEWLCLSSLKIRIHPGERMNRSESHMTTNQQPRKIAKDSSAFEFFA